jgi:hypothetical protein
MSHATLVNDGLFWFVILLTLLLMMFIYAVIATPPDDAVRAEPPTLNASAPAAALSAGRPQAPTSPAGAARQSGDAHHAARHTTAAVPVILCVPKTSSTSCDQAIFIDQSTDTSLFSDAVLIEVDRLG